MPFLLSRIRLNEEVPIPDHHCRKGQDDQETGERVKMVLSHRLLPFIPPPPPAPAHASRRLIPRNPALPLINDISYPRQNCGDRFETEWGREIRALDLLVSVSG
jgi:hypothetical protein